MSCMRIKKKKTEKMSNEKKKDKTYKPKPPKTLETTTQKTR